MKVLRCSPFQRHDGVLVVEIAASDGYQVKTIVYQFGTGHQAALAMFEMAEKIRLVANDALRDAPRPAPGR